MDVWRRTQVSAICVTHDVDEAILLADRVIMMTNGPHAKVGKILEVDLPRPRTRKQLLQHPDYYRLREELLSFLQEYEHGPSQNKKKAKTFHLDELTKSSREDGKKQQAEKISA